MFLDIYYVFGKGVNYCLGVNNRTRYPTKYFVSAELSMLHLLNKTITY